MKNGFPIAPLREVLVQYQEYIENPEPKVYPKLSVKLYGKGVVIDESVEGATLKMKRHQIAKSGQVILSEIWGKKGAIGFVPSEGHGALCTSHFFLFDVCHDKLNPKYLQAIFTANYLQSQLDSEAKGTTGYAAVRPKNLLAAEIPLPPLEEQQRIVARIEELAIRIDEARGLRKETIDEAEALIKAAQRRLIGEVPITDWLPLRTYVMEIENGWSPACENHPASDNEWGVLKVGAVSFGVYQEFENKALPSILEPRPEFEVHSGDFLMSRANTTNLVGACTFVRQTRQKLMLSDKIFRFVFRDDKTIEHRYLENVLQSPVLRSQIEHGATGTSPTMKNISKEKVFNLLIPMHDIEEQYRIVAYLDDLQAKIDTLKQLQAETLAELDALLPSILDKAFKGELV